MSSPITTSLLTCAASLMQEQLVTFKEEVLTKPDESERLLLLLSLGFDGTKEVKVFQNKMAKYFKAIEENAIKKESVNDYNEYLKKAFEILIRARQDFGENTLLVNFYDFQNIMRKYNLVCGLFSDYKGDVPQDKLIEIANIPKSFPEYVKPLHKFNQVEFYNDRIINIIPSELKRFPFIIVEHEDEELQWMRGKDCLGTNYRQCHNDIKYAIFARNLVGDYTKLFICAPEKMMVSLGKGISFRRAKDPFICSYTQYGILILTKWGEEASSKVIKKYKKLNNLIDKRARELNIY